MFMTMGLMKEGSKCCQCGAVLTGKQGVTLGVDDYCHPCGAKVPNKFTTAVKSLARSHRAPVPAADPVTALQIR